MGTNISHYNFLGGNGNKAQRRTCASQRAQTTSGLLGVSRILGGVNGCGKELMTIKQLKDALSVKGINANKMKKNEMIELIEKTKIVVEKSPLSIDE